MTISNEIKRLLLVALTCLLSACIGSSQSLTEEENQGLTWLNKCSDWVK